ncbi:hypothetical protein NIES593_06825 [Hydrococcus rivularis NIES-593]|uniref:Uncharacterized protein n=1 Tax=Hydrococcus rivularis NIES-593 TaxID=1921803 RepID=A0A1U7HMZ5_9CYAN|nr:hypothetical protein [Hydrococcus rivularis]OKH24918.1 hypothetical protein NIES593_06825 [Hydrococcus rivularis NIES-593]
MARRKTITHFVAVSDINQPADEQEGILIEVEGKEGDTLQNRTQALEILQQMWERGEIEADKFPDGMTAEHLFYVPPESSRLQKSQVPQKTDILAPVIQGAQEIVQLTKLQLEVQEAAEEAFTYVPIIQSVLEKTRPLTAEEKELVKDKIIFIAGNDEKQRFNIQRLLDNRSSYQ